MAKVTLNSDGVSGFVELKARLDALPNQVMGDPCAICQTGELYVTIMASALSRPGDVAVIERQVAREMAARLEQYLEEKSGRIYWRERFVWDVDEVSVVVRYDENGPDKDDMLDRKCVLDKDWVKVKGYCRLYRATLQEMQPKESL